MLATFGGWCLLALCYLLIASSTVAWVVYWKSPDIDSGGHIGLRRSRRKFSSKGSIPTSSVCDPQCAGHALTNSTDMEIQKKDGLHSEEFEGREKASLSLADHARLLGKRSFSGSDKEQAGERDWNIHRIPPKPRYPPGVAHYGRIDTVQGEQPKISRRTLALRAMTLRLIGYILIPVICILPSVIKDLIIKAHPVGDVEIPERVTGCIDGINGLVGLFNAILFLLDPVLLIIWTELRANHCWGLLRKQRTDHENDIEVNPMAESPSQGTKTLGSGGGDEQVGGIRTTRFGREENRRSTTRAFQDSLVASVPLPNIENENRSRHLTQAVPNLPQIENMGRSKRHEARHNGGAGLIIHVQVEITKYNDLERVEDYLHGL
jgi:hypothetical protein